MAKKGNRSNGVVKGLKVMQRRGNSSNMVDIDSEPFRPLLSTIITGWIALVAEKELEVVGQKRRQESIPIEARDQKTKKMENQSGINQNQLQRARDL